jgi:hypothetical protein
MGSTLYEQVFASITSIPYIKMLLAVMAGKVAVAVGVLVGVTVGVNVGVDVNVAVGSNVAVEVSVGTGVAVGSGARIVHPSNTNDSRITYILIIKTLFFISYLLR